jgi:transketolase
MGVPNKAIRRTIVDIVHNSGAAHIGSALSVVEIANAIYRSVDLGKIKAKDPGRDRIILSKGHAAAGLYAVLHHQGLLSDEEVNTYFKNGTLLAGHASHNVPCVEHSTGALGHGLPVGLGVAIGLKSKKILARVFVITGDGELHEGSNWEAIMLAGHLKLGNLVILVDQNHLSQFGSVDVCCDVDPLKAKFESFKWNAVEVDGHNEEQIIKSIDSAKNSDRPTAIICHTIKGKGISFMENDNIWHYRSPQGEDYEKAKAELVD